MLPQMLPQLLLLVLLQVHSRLLELVGRHPVLDSLGSNYWIAGWCWLVGSLAREGVQNRMRC
jgi:hypothetical protein